MTFPTFFSDIYIFSCLLTYDTGSTEYLVVYVNIDEYNKCSAINTDCFRNV